jgi:hypothetical protein
MLLLLGHAHAFDTASRWILWSLLLSQYVFDTYRHLRCHQVVLVLGNTYT